MKTVVIGKDIVRAPFGAELYAGMRYVLTNRQIEMLREYEGSSGFTLIGESELCELPPMWHGEQHGSVLVFNTGAIGDQLWTTALVHEMHLAAPRLEIDVVTEATTDILWSNSRDIRGTRLQPLPADAATQYDYVVFYDEITSSRFDEEQPDCYASIFEPVGLTAPTIVKPIVHPLHEHEVSAYHQLLQPDENGMVWGTRGHFVVGLHSSSQVRNLPFETQVAFVEALSKEVPNQKIYLLSTDEFGGRVSERLVGLPNVVLAHRTLNLLQIAALCRYATCVISPDSMPVHLAASQDAPTVALMSTVPPKYRVARYPYCVPVFRERACPHGCFYKHPTFAFALGDIQEFAQCYIPERVSCDRMNTIDIREIFEAMNIAIKRKTSVGYDQRDLPMS